MSLAAAELADAVTKSVFATIPKDPMGALADALADFRGLTHDAEFKCAAKLVRENVPRANIRLFLSNLRFILSGETAFIREDTVTPVTDLPYMRDLVKSGPPANAGELVKKVVICKLNGGLGTGMGLNTAKSLLDVKNGKTFLDLIAQQTLSLRTKFGCNVRFMLMDSFSTSADTAAFFASKYPNDFGGDVFKKEIEFMQSKVPKILQTTKMPAAVPSNPDTEFCPPGHGEFYTSLASSGMLDRLIAEGFEYIFVSNSDNLGATLDLSLLSYFAANDLEFCMEVCERAPVDSKGGHLVRDSATKRLILRESAQCHGDDASSYTDIAKHRYFNTNNMWVNIAALKKAIAKNGGMLPLPVIMNSKTVVPTDAASDKVFQLENAMGAAISYFDKAQAVVVERDRFAPVKTCADLLSLRSDVFEETDDHRLVLRADRDGKPPVVSLEDKHYKFVSQFEKLIPEGAPSMKDCAELKVQGPMSFSKGTVLEGKVSIVAKSSSQGGGEEGERAKLPAGTYTGSVEM